MQEYSPSFEDVFGIPAPDADTVNKAAEALVFKHRTDGEPAGLIALMNVAAIRDAAAEMVAGTAESYASDKDIDPELAHELVLAGFVNAAELIATILMHARK